MTSGPREDLGQYRWHVGAPVRWPPPGEPWPVLFRDVGPAATALFLRGRLRRLSGRSPVVYLRTADWVEPYEDHEAIGRLVVLRPDLLEPWITGLPHVHVASVRHAPSARTVGFVPGHVPLQRAAGALRDVRDPDALREVFGGGAYDEVVGDTLRRLDQLQRELEDAERLAEPARRALQSGTPRQREAVWAWMDRAGVTEADLCAAWHHVPRDRRAHLLDALPSLQISSRGPTLGLSSRGPTAGIRA